MRAEELAWQMSRDEEHPFELNVLLPTLIWGPMIPGQPHLNTSANALVGHLVVELMEFKGCPCAFTCLEGFEMI